MGAITFSIDPRLVACLQDTLPISTFIETGTFKGDAAATLAPIMDRVITIEFSEGLWKEASERLKDLENVEVLLGDSAALLQSVAAPFRDAATLYWLDAHWCVAEGTAGEHSQCPLLAEIAAIEALNDTSVILIDDARLFLATPPAPHDVTQWPSFAAVIHGLQLLSATHELAVVNDVIAFYPPAARDALDRFAHEHGVDWLHAAQALDEAQSLRAGLEEKEAQIRLLDTALQQARRQLTEAKDQGNEAAQLEEKEEVIRSLLLSNSDALNQHAELVLRMQEANAAKLEEKEGVIRSLLKINAQAEQQHQQLIAQIQEVHAVQQMRAGLLTPEVHALLVRGLEEKEAVIQEMKKALNAYRSAFALLGVFTRPITRFIPVSSFSNLIPRPRLGTLYQHGPQEVVIPRSYSRAPALAGTPLISLVTPSFKQAAFIERTINSVLEQKYPNLEYFVQDGGSEDGTRDILERYADRLAGWKSEPDSGQSQAINLGFARTSGDIMAWLNSDDVLLPGALHCVANYFNSNPGVDVVYGHRLLIDENDRLIGRWILPGHDDNVLSWADYIPQETLFWRRSIWEKAGGTIDESFRFAMDWDLLLRFRHAGARFARIDRFMGGFRIHPHQKTSAAINEVGFKEMDRLRERSLGRLPTHPEIRRAVMPYLLRHVACEIGWRIREKLGAHR